MAKIEDLIAQIPDERLRKGIAAEVKALKKTKKFGLVFEEHLPETVRLPRMPVKPGDLVALKRESGNQLWRIRSIKKNIALCDRAVEGYPDPKDANREFPVSDLVVVRNFGDPIYPALVPIDRVERGGPDKPWHVLINADNFHALQLLLYCYEGKVDVIYIDPPYNTGARDWKYNNDYVDKNDAFRHSKWLSMMKKRLSLAKRLLKNDGVLICTIDEHEVHHLGVLLQQTFSECAQQMVTIVINQKGVAQGRLARVEEYAIYVFNQAATIQTHHDDLLSPQRDKLKGLIAPRWERLLRGGNNSRREDRPGLFYPIYIDPKLKKITKVGEVLPLGSKPNMKGASEGLIAWPIRTDGSLGNWQAKPATLKDLIAQGFVKLGGFDKKRQTWTVLYLNRGTRARIEQGEINITGKDECTGAVEIAYASAEAKQSNIKTVWHRSLHDSGIYGSGTLRAIVGQDVDFSFPKSIYAVRDALGSVLRRRKQGVVLDFFAGSGTTLHATCLLNAEDGGSRQCIVVTNNEVAESNAKVLEREGTFQSDEKYEAMGVTEAVTWPRCKYAINGKRDSGEFLAGSYVGGRDMADGFEENMEYFRFDFLDPAEVARGDAFQAILPILWMMAGCHGSREDSKGSQPWFIPKHSPFAVLIREKEFRVFRERLSDRKDIAWVFLVTDSEENFALMRRSLGTKVQCVQLYKSYLENFRLNTPEALGRVQAS
jgi:adenine-specific DNA-methyltransferase